MQVKSSGYNAEYRATTGGVISAITKSGGNSFHGSVGTYSPTTTGSARAARRCGSNPAEQTQGRIHHHARRPGFITWDPVVDIGGPILRDRVWFFAGYSPQHIEQRDGP